MLFRSPVTQTTLTEEVSSVLELSFLCVLVPSLLRELGIPGVFLQEVPHCASFPHHNFKGICETIIADSCSAPFRPCIVFTLSTLLFVFAFSFLLLTEPPFLFPQFSFLFSLLIF